jgi:hypothetical protein
MLSMMDVLRKLRVPHSPGAPLFFFTTRDDLRATDPLTHTWTDGNGRHAWVIQARDWRPTSTA